MMDPKSFGLIFSDLLTNVFPLKELFMLVLKFEVIGIAFCNFCKWLFCHKNLLKLPTMFMEFELEFKTGNFSCAELRAK